MSQEFVQNAPRHWLHTRDVGKQNRPQRRIYLQTWDNCQVRITTMSTKVSKVRVGAATMLAAVGLSLVAPAVASANPYVPFSGPLHPIRHYAADALHPIYSITHPIRSIIP
jgi:hypothetical protein